MDEAYRPQTHRAMMFLMAALVLPMAALNVYRGDGMWWYLAAVGVSVVLMVAAMWLDYRKIHGWSFFLLAVALVMEFVAAMVRPGGAVRFLAVEDFRSFVPAALFGALPAFAVFMHRGGGWGAIAKIFLAAGVFVLVPLFLAHAAGNVFLFMFGVFTAVFVAVMHGRHLAVSRSLFVFFAVTAAVALVFVLRASSAYAPQMEVFMSRGASDPLGAGYMNTLIDRLLGSSKWFGTASDGLSPLILNSFPVLALIAYFGRVAGGAFVLAVLALVVVMFNTARKIKNAYGYFVFLLICASFAARYVVGMLMAFGFFPIFDIDLPLLSTKLPVIYSDMLLFGLMLSVWRRNEAIEAEPAGERSGEASVSLSKGLLEKFLKWIGLENEGDDDDNLDEDLDDEELFDHGEFKPLRFRPLFESHSEVRELFRSLENDRDAFRSWALDDEHIKNLNTYLRRYDVPGDILFLVTDCFCKNEDYTECYFIRLDIGSLLHKQDDCFFAFFIDRLVSVCGDAAFPWERFPVRHLDDALELFLDDESCENETTQAACLKLAASWQYLRDYGMRRLPRKFLGAVIDRLCAKPGLFLEKCYLEFLAGCRFEDYGQKCAPKKLRDFCGAYETDQNTPEVIVSSIADILERGK